MAEVAAGAIAAEQVIATAVEAGVVATVAKPTLPLTASLTQVFRAQASDQSLLLARSHHTVTTIGSKAYIFGGRGPDKQLCSSDIHAFSVPGGQQDDSAYACYPAVAAQNEVPPSRLSHAACARKDSLIIHDILILQDGQQQGQAAETWLFDFATASWFTLPSVPGTPLVAQLVKSTLYAISGGPQAVESLHVLKLDSTGKDLSDLEWKALDFPTKSSGPAPQPRIGSALITISTGYGRHYLLYLLGSEQNENTTAQQASFFSDIWSLQLPADGVTATGAKDAIRNAIPGVESGELRWSEVQIAAKEVNEAEGKAHPGPRGFFGADRFGDGTSVFLWGGINAKGETESDGWLIKVT